jgi:CspA family cold shock protein
MPTRKVRWFNTTKGFSFIAPNDGGPDIFFHISAVEQSGLTGLADDQPIRYQLVEGQDGRKLAGELERI